jgi:DHA1 family multidrug resistance protein-like MFS transporter
MLTQTQRHRGLTVLLIDTFLMFAGFFMLVPLISVYYVEQLGFAAAAIGIVLAARQLTQQGLTLFGGALADRWGAKGLICWGMVIRAFAFAGLAWATTFNLLLALCVLAAIGGALFDAPKSAAIAALAEPSERTRFFSLTGIAGGLGMTVGPLVGALLLQTNFQLVCFVSAASFAIAALVTIIGLPAVQTSEGQTSIVEGLGLAVRNRRFVLFTMLLGGFWFMWVQLSISLTLVAQRWGTPTLATPFGPFMVNGVAWIYGLNAGLTVALQYPLLRLVERWLRPLVILVLGIALMAVGLGLVAMAHSLGALLGCVVLFSFGAMLVQPTQQSVTAQLADPRALGAYFGFSALALAFGGGLGNYLGGWLYDAARRWQTPALPWIIFCGIGLSVAVGLALLDYIAIRNDEQHKTAPTSQPA